MRLIISVFFILILSVSAYPFSDQVNTERMLNENKDFIEFINICMSNFGQRLEQYKERFLEIYQYHFNAQVFFLQSDYKNAYRNIRESQKKQKQLYLDVLRKLYLEDAKSILDKLAPEIIKSKNARARLYLTLGYRDRAVGKNFQKIGSASNPKLYSYIIYKYEKAIKLTRRAKRYGFLALYESRSDEIKRKIFNQLLEKENEEGKVFYRRFLGLDEKSFLDEMGKTYYDADAIKKDNSKPGEKKEAAKDETTFERKVEKRVRFRLERRLANNLINNEFDKAEDIIRKYVNDFNFKLIQSTIEVVSKEPPGEEGVQKTDYKSYFDHHYDNYLRLPKDRKSLLDVLSTEVKVVDDIDDIKDENVMEESTVKKDKEIKKESEIKKDKSSTNKEGGKK